MLAIVSSATDLEEENGELKTGIPRRARGRSEAVGVPIQNVPIAKRFGKLARLSIDRGRAV